MDKKKSVRKQIDMQKQTEVKQFNTQVSILVPINIGYFISYYYFVWTLCFTCYIPVFSFM